MEGILKSERDPMAKAFKFNNNHRLIIINFLKEELNFASSEFLIKKKPGKNTWGTQRNFKLVLS